MKETEYTDNNDSLTEENTFPIINKASITYIQGHLYLSTANYYKLNISHTLKRSGHWLQCG